MKYLTITNPGECPIEGFTILGVSTARGNDSAIGQFGSGNKHAVNVLLRHGINPIIYSGRDKLSFYTEAKLMGSKQYNQVYYQLGNRKPIPLSMSLEYGEQDWTTVDMALREFLSNALDAVGGDASQIGLEIRDAPRAKAGYTTVALPLTPEIQRWFCNLSSYFLHFTLEGAKEGAFPVAESGCGAKIYRKGVFVRECGKNALFNYNLGRELQIDECRNLSEGRLKDTLAQFAAKEKIVLEGIFPALVSGQVFWEQDFPEWVLKYYGKKNRVLWQSVWKALFGDAVISFGCSPLSERAALQGHRVEIINSASWYAGMIAAGIPSVFSVLDGVSEEGVVYVEPEERDTEVLRQVWSWLELIDLTGKKEIPEFTLFEEPMKAESQRMGFYSAGTVYVHVEHRANHQVYLEELTHYITGSGDYSLDFQDFAFRVATKLALVFEGATV